MMNRMIGMAVLALATLALCVSCAKSSEDSRAKGDGIIYPHMITFYVVPQKVVLLPNNLSVLSNYMPRPEGKSLTLGWSGRELSPDRASDRDEYLALARQYGDKDYNRAIPTPISHVALSRVVRSIDLIAQTDYDKAHPAGTSLNDIVTVSYGTFMPVIKNGYQYKKDAQYASGAEIHARAKLSAFNSVELLRVCVNGNIGAEGSSRTSCLFEFVEKPISPEQEIEAIVTFSDGSRMTDRVRMTID